MIKISSEFIDDTEYGNVGDGAKVYGFRKEARGVRDKFWLDRDKSKFISEEYKNLHMLFKYNRNNKSCEDWGEVFASKIGKQVGLNIVDYFLACYDNGKDVQRGVVCGSYLESDNQAEMSVHSLQTVYSPFFHDKDTNTTNKEINTVYSILDDVATITSELSKEDELVMQKNVKNDLLKQCLFDFILAQTDRHWQNTTFLIYEKGDKFFMKKAPAYDNGCIAYLKRKQSAIKGISKEVGVNSLNSPRMKELMEKYIPMMGVKTSTVKLSPSYTGESNVKLKTDLHMKDILIDELTEEILTNPEIAVFYTLFKRDFNMDKIVDQLRREGDEPPEEVVKMIKDVISYQINTLEIVLQKKLAKIHDEEMEMKR